MSILNPENIVSRRTFIKGAAVAGMALTSMSVVYGNTVEPYDIDITLHQIPLHNLTSEFDGYKIIQITDLHMGSWLDKEQLIKIVQIINSYEPDLVAITGDFITLGRIANYADDLVESLSLLQANDGVVAVLGNHDHWANVEQTREVLVKANIKELPNEHIVINRESAQLVIAGLDDIWEKQHDIDHLISQLPKDAPAVLLAHEPDIADETSQTGLFGLQISGHSHGGQIRLPIIEAPYLPRLAKKYPIGRYEVNGMVQYTNRGIGMVDIPIRIGCRPEIAIFTLTSENQGI